MNPLQAQVRFLRIFSVALFVAVLLYPALFMSLTVESQ